MEIFCGLSLALTLSQALEVVSGIGVVSGISVFGEWFVALSGRGAQVNPVR